MFDGSSVDRMEMGAQTRYSDKLSALKQEKKGMYEHCNNCNEVKTLRKTNVGKARTPKVALLSRLVFSSNSIKIAYVCIRISTIYSLGNCRYEAVTWRYFCAKCAKKGLILWHGPHLWQGDELLTKITASDNGIRFGGCVRVKYENFYTRTKYEYTCIKMCKDLSNAPCRAKIQNY